MLPDDVFEVLRTDREVYSRECLRIVGYDGTLQPLIYRRAQQKVEAAVRAQRAAGKPVRVRILKSRRTGISTKIQGDLLHGATLTPNTRALTVAQDNDTAGELFGIADTMYANLPDSRVDPRLKPGMVSMRLPSSTGKALMHFGEPARALRLQGDRGVDSQMKIDTAKEVDAGRGKTITRLHMSEAAFWEKISAGSGAKVLALVNAVYDGPHTEIYEETTANGLNAFKGRWDRTVKGFGSFMAVFIGWLDDPNLVLAFDHDDHRAKFEREVLGRGEYGADEWRLLQQGATLEQLLWRRNAIVDKADGDLAKFKQEYPSVPEEAFMGTGKHVFSVSRISAALDIVSRYDPEHEHARDQAGIWTPPAGVAVPPVIGRLEGTGVVTRQLFAGTAEAPQGARFLPGEPADPNLPTWKVWEPPLSISRAQLKLQAGEIDEGTMAAHAALCAARNTPEAAYVVFVDPSMGRSNTVSEGAFAAIQVIDHATGDQVARYRSHEDPDMIATQAVLAALYWNMAWLGIEITGGYGLPVINQAYDVLGYPKLYERQILDGPVKDSRDRFGWSTDMKTKPLLEANMAELLREGSHGLRDMDTALELTTYVKDNRGRSVPEKEAFADLLMSYMGAQELRRLIPLVLMPAALPGAERPNSMVRSRA